MDDHLANACGSTATRYGLPCTAKPLAAINRFFRETDDLVEPRCKCTARKHRTDAVQFDEFVLELHKYVHRTPADVRDVETILDVALELCHIIFNPLHELPQAIRTFTAHKFELHGLPHGGEGLEVALEIVVDGLRHIAGNALGVVDRGGKLVKIRFRGVDNRKEPRHSFLPCNR